MKWVRLIAQTTERCKAFKQLRGKLERAFLCAVALYRKALIMTTKIQTMGELEAQNSDGFRNPIRTPEEQAAIDRLTKAMREHDQLMRENGNGEIEDDDFDDGEYHPHGDPQI
jgi:hypothetical protein